MQKETAKHITGVMLKCSDMLVESVSYVKKTESEEEFRAYREIVSKLMMEMLLRVLNPAFAEHPELKPPGWDSRAAPSSAGGGSGNRA